MEIINYTNNIYRETAISWALHAIKILFGIENVRKTIIKSFHPDVQNIKWSRTFDAFQQIPTEKETEILGFCKQIINIQPYVVFTASNIQEHADDKVTHYQSYYVDNDNKHIYVIDPAKPVNGYGIYYPSVTIDVIQPFFVSKGYAFDYITLSNPAQTIEADVFCQSWTLYILLHILQNGIGHVHIPIKQINKYGVILQFFKDVLTKNPHLSYDLDNIYLEEIKNNKELILKDGTKKGFNCLLKMDPYHLIMQTQKEDMLVS